MAENMQIKVSMQAIDKFTAPLKNIISVAKRWEKNANKVKEIEKQWGLNKDLMAKFQKTGEGIRSVQEQIRTYQATLKTLNGQIVKGEVPNQKLIKQIQKTKLTLSKLTQKERDHITKLKNISGELKKAGVNVGNFKQRQASLQQQIEKTNRTISWQKKVIEANNKIAKVGQILRKGFTPNHGIMMWGASLGVGGSLLLDKAKSAGNAIGGMVATAAKFEKIQSVLKTVEGSDEKARQSMQWVSNFATSTPYELDQVSEAFVRLKAYGLDPTNGLLETLGDTASAMGKDVMQAVEAIADAVTGENERLKEFGIKASSKGETITYTYTDKAGNQQSKIVDKNNRKQIEQTLQVIWNEKYKGAMKEQSKTFAGLMSNLADQWTRFQQMVMSSGAFDWVKSKLQGVLDTINKMAGNGELQRWAEDVGQAIKEVGVGLWECLKHALKFAKWVANLTRENKGIVASFSKWAVILGVVLTAFAPLIFSLSVIIPMIGAINALFLANPIGLFITALVALGAGLVYCYNRFEGFRNVVNTVFSAIKETAIAVVDGVAGFFSQGWEQMLSKAVAFLASINPVTLLISEFAKLKDLLPNALTEAMDKVKNAWESFKSIFTGSKSTVAMQTVNEQIQTHKMANLPQPFTPPSMVNPTNIAQMTKMTPPPIKMDTRPPLMMKPQGQTVNAPQTNHITINTTGGNSQEIAQAVQKALAEQHRNQQAKMRGSLVDRF